MENKDIKKGLDNLRECMLDLTDQYGRPGNTQKRNLWNSFYALEKEIESLNRTNIEVNKGSFKYFKKEIKKKLDQLSRMIAGDAPKNEINRVLSEIELLKQAKQYFKLVK